MKKGQVFQESKKGHQGRGEEGRSGGRVNRASRKREGKNEGKGWEERGPKARALEKL